MMTLAGRRRALSYSEGIDAGEEATTSESVIAEVFYVLTREKGRFRFARQDVAEPVRALLQSAGHAVG